MQSIVIIFEVDELATTLRHAKTTLAHFLDIITRLTNEPDFNRLMPELLRATTETAQADGGLLFLMAVTSLEVYGVIIAGWASNSKYPFLAALRSAAQMVSYEVSIGFVIVTVNEPCSPTKYGPAKSADPITGLAPSTTIVSSKLPITTGAPLSLQYKVPLAS